MIEITEYGMKILVFIPTWFLVILSIFITTRLGLTVVEVYLAVKKYRAEQRIKDFEGRS